MNLLLKKTITNLKKNLVERNSEITVGSIPYLPVLPSQINELFTNLIVNAIKFTKEDVKPKIEIVAEQPILDEIFKLGGNNETNYIKIKVSDNGMGFSNEYANRIFQPFYRLNNKKDFSGSGLGLTLCKKIILNHNGMITTNSTINKGTIIIIYLPIA